MSLLLVPGQGTAGTEVLAVGIADWAAVVALQMLQPRNWRALGPVFHRTFVMRVALGQVATLPFVVAGIAVLGWGTDGLYWLVPGIVFSFMVALFDAWVLLIEINR